MGIMTFRPGRQASTDLVVFRKDKDGRLSVSFGPELKVLPGDQILPEYDPEANEWIFTLCDDGYKSQSIPSSGRARISFSRVPEMISTLASDSRWTAVRKRDQIIVTPVNSSRR
jgi:hypothetical protein